MTVATKLKMLAPWKKSYDKPKQCIKKQRHHFANRGPYSKAMVFITVMYGCESWTIKKAERRRIDASELWYWRRLQPVHPKGDQSWVFIGKTDAKAETPIPGHLMGRVDSLEKTLMLGGIGGRRRRV